MTACTNRFNRTVRACYVGYIVQAIINNFAPLLFLTFERTYHLSADRIALLITVNFGFQLAVDFLAANLIDRLGQRFCIVFAHIAAAVGLVGLGFLPDLLPSPYAGLILSIGIYAVGSGLIEVMISPLVEACPSSNKEAAMSLLHSFYCWGHVLVVIVSTVFFRLFGIENWRILACLWAVIPFCNIFVFLRVPLATLTENGRSAPIFTLLRSKLFWLLVVMMLCAGASEQAMSQWASAFAEAGLGVSKTVGDLLGPCAFAVMMGLSRMFYGKSSGHIRLHRFMIISAVMCIGSYLLASLTKSAVWGLVGCALCGLSVGIMWPGTFSIAAGAIPSGGTAMFSLLALAGDLGCASGPALVGYAETLRDGLLLAMVFPVVLAIGILIFALHRKKSNTR